MKSCEIKYEMQMSCIELKSIESAFVEDDNTVEKISFYEKSYVNIICQAISAYYSVIHLVRIYNTLK